MKKNKPILRRAQVLIITVFLLLMGNTAFAQDIQVLNIPDSQGSSGPANGYRSDITTIGYGYHLSATRADNPGGFGGSMARAKSKLTNTANFGPGGITNRRLVITDAFGLKGSITDISQLNSYDIIYIGAYLNNSGSAFTAAEINILLNWSKQQGKVLMLQEQSDYNPISTTMGYGITSNSTYPNTTAFPADNYLNTKLFSGVFGNAGAISQGGSAQGYFSSGCTGVPIAGNSAGFATILLNQEYRDILVADTDFFTRLQYSAGSMYGDISAGNGINNDTDRVWANLWAWAVNEVVNQVAPNTTQVVGGEAYSDELPLCNGATSITVKLRNHNAAIRNWETSTNNGSTWTTIASTSSSITYSNPVAGQQFRAVVGNPGCTTTSSSAVVTVFNVGAPTVTSSLSNVCPATTVNLDSAHTGTKPSGTNLVWFTNSTHSGTALTATQVANAGAGTYYAYYQSTSNTNCYSTASNAVTVTISSCATCNAGTSQVPLTGNTLSN